MKELVREEDGGVGEGQVREEDEGVGEGGR